MYTKSADHSSLHLALCLLLTMLTCAAPCLAGDKIRVLVWDEQQPVEKPPYGNFPGNFIADHLRKNPALEVASASITDPEQGLALETLEQTDVLLFWSHVRHRDISEKKGQEISDLVKAGKLAFVPLHSSHWCVPFMVCMQDKAAQDALSSLPESTRSKARIAFEGQVQWKKAGEFERNLQIPRFTLDDEGNVLVTLKRPNCVFPRCCGPGQPSHVRILHEKHPICQGVPATFNLEMTEMYDEPFGVPEPDTVLFTEQWAGGEFFRSGCLWNLGKGRIFYFRPGDQQYAVYDNPHLLKIIENACLWLGENAE